MKTDILVIGTGIAGLSYAIKAAVLNPRINIMVVAKDQPQVTTTRHAQGGIAVVTNFRNDSNQKHIDDTLMAGDGLCDKNVVNTVIKEGLERIEELEAWGCQFDRATNTNKWHLTQEGGHSEKRIIHHKDQTGLEIQTVLLQKIKTLQNVTILSEHILIDLITAHQFKGHPQRCYGAYIISKSKKQIHSINSCITVLATGGVGQLYQITTNPKGATGDGIGAAYRAGVQISELPYMQFHPTVVYQKKGDSPLLISEALRGEGARIRNHKGKYFLNKIDPRGELAPRDIVSRALKSEIDRTQHPYLYLDCSAVSKNKLKTHFSHIYNTCKKRGIHLPKDPIPIVPGAHYLCGGIVVNLSGQTSLEGLFAIGECSRTGLHGANRLASNSLLESLVFAHRAAKKSLELLAVIRRPHEELPTWKGNGYRPSDSENYTAELRKNIQKIMSEHLGVYKTNNGLKKAYKKLEKVYQQIQKHYHKQKLTPAFCEVRNLIAVAYLMVCQALEIERNQGTFYNLDYEK